MNLKLNIMKIKNQLLIVLFFAFGLVSVKSQIGLAAAKNENGSVIRWYVRTGESNYFSCQQEAKKRLQSMGYNNVSTYPGGDCCGHKIPGGYYVVVQSSYTKNGRTKNSVGMGASASSYRQAEQRAVENLKTHDWGWSSSKGYKVMRRRTY